VPIAIVTDRDIVMAAVAGDPEHIQYLLVSDVMTSDLVTATEQESIEHALNKMHEHGVRRLPIVDAAGTLVGILTLDDILRYLTAQQSELVALVAREQQRERQYRV
jgi:CBS domain-containing protein